MYPCSRGAGWEEVYPGWGGDWVGREVGYTGTPAQPSQGPILTIFHASEPTYGQMKVFYEVSYEVS